MQTQLIFLSHMSRTGSTFLCKLLDQYEAISVGVEGFFPDNIIRRAPIIRSENALDKYLTLLYEDIRFRGWNLERKDIKSRLLKYKFPIPYKKVLLTCLNMYFPNSKGKSDVFIHKCGWYIDYIDQVKKTYPKAKIIYSVRDPRGIYNSALKANMSNNKYSIVNMALFFKKRYAIAKGSTGEDLIIVQYEKLISEPEETIKGILKFLKIKNFEKTETHYAEKVPQGFKYLHTNISKKGIHSRINAWQTELDDFSQFFIQTVCKKEIMSMDLPILKYRIQIRDYLKFVFFYTNYLLKKFRNSIIGLSGYQQYIVDRLIHSETLKK